MRNTFDRCAITAFHTVVSMKPIFRRYILNAFVPDIVKNSKFGKSSMNFFILETSMSPVMTNGTRSRKKVCCAWGRSSDFTKTPLSHQIVQAARIANTGNIFHYSSFSLLFRSVNPPYLHTSFRVWEVECEFLFLLSFTSRVRWYRQRFYCLETMSDDNNSASFKEMFKCSCYFFFTVTIESRCWFIEENNLWILRNIFAIARRCFCPQLSLTPRSPISVLMPCSSSYINLTFCELYSSFDIFCDGFSRAP